MASAPAAAAFSRDGRNERNLQPRHLSQVVCDSFGLSPLFRSQAGISAGNIDQGNDRPAPLFSKTHNAEGFAIAFGIRLSEIAIDALLGFAALLGSDDYHFPAIEARHTGDDGRVVAEATISVEFAEIGEDAFDVVEQVRPHGMASQLGSFPGAQFA